jgi:hypothetical protein
MPQSGVSSGVSWICSSVRNRAPACNRPLASKQHEYWRFSVWCASVRGVAKLVKSHPKSSTDSAGPLAGEAGSTRLGP